MILVNRLNKVYKNGYKAVDNLSLKIEEGDIYGFLGPNGAGKTTTIRMLIGLLEPTSGEILVDGMAVKTNESKIKNIIGVLPESHGFYDWMTAYEYLKYFYELYALDASNKNYHIEYLLKKVGLFERRNSKVGQFSRGMKQRLGIAKALINNPKIIFLDEPTLGLDPTGQRDIHNLIKELNESLNVTVFITSHLLKDIEVLCNKIAIVKNGRLLVEDNIRNLQEKYSDDINYSLNTSNNNLALEIIKENGYCSEVGLSDGEIKLSFDKADYSDDTMHSIIETIFTNKIDIYEVSRSKVTIEDIFINLVNDAEKEVS